MPAKSLLRGVSTQRGGMVVTTEATSPAKPVATRSQKREEELSPRSPEKAQPCCHLDVNPTELASVLVSFPVAVTEHLAEATWEGKVCSQFEGAVPLTWWEVTAAEGIRSRCTHSREAEMNTQLMVSFWPVHDPTLENGAIYI